MVLSKLSKLLLYDGLRLKGLGLEVGLVWCQRHAEISQQEALARLVHESITDLQVKSLPSNFGQIHNQVKNVVCGQKNLTVRKWKAHIY